jgi:hypothetical protein
MVDCLGRASGQAQYSFSLEISIYDCDITLE